MNRLNRYRIIQRHNNAITKDPLFLQRHHINHPSRSNNFKDRIVPTLINPIFMKANILEESIDPIVFKITTLVTLIDPIVINGSILTSVDPIVFTNDNSIPRDPIVFKGTILSFREIQYCSTEIYKLDNISNSLQRHYLARLIRSASFQRNHNIIPKYPIIFKGSTQTFQRIHYYSNDAYRSKRFKRNHISQPSISKDPIVLKTLYFHSILSNRFQRYHINYYNRSKF